MARSALIGVLLSGATALAVEAPPEEDPTQKRRGPIFSGCIRWRSAEDVIAYKGIVITLGQKQDAYVCYDTELVRWSLAWVTDGTQFGMVVPKFNSPLPRVKGTPVFGTAAGPGWARGGVLADPRRDKRGSLPKDWAHHQGLYLHGRQVVLHYTVGGTDILELPGYVNVQGLPVFTRVFQAAADVSELALAVLHVPGAELTPVASGAVLRNPRTGHALLLKHEGEGAVSWKVIDDTLVLQAGSIRAHRPLRLAIASLGKLEAAAARSMPDLPPMSEDLRQWTRGGRSLWPDPVTTQGQRGIDEGPYVVDRLTEPTQNPWNADTLFGGIDFFSDGRAVLCTVQGEVWVVSGLDDSLRKLSWRRFASGLFQPLGLRVVKDEVHVLGRDQITRLRDLNGDGQADHYANVNNDALLSSNGADYSFDLQTDSAGNFFFAKATPWYPDVDTPHQGVVLKVTADGAKLEVVATGLRVPNGLAVGPGDEIAVSDQQGHWMPSSKVNLIRPGGFYGMMPSAQRPIEMNWAGKTIRVNPSDPAVRQQLGFTGYGPKNPMPTGHYDPPLAWLPWMVDSSSGSPFWALTDRWGPLGGQLLFTSYGRCALFATLRHKVGDLEQAAMVPFNLPFDTGIMRGRVNPKDGQVYVAGLRGWLTTAQRDSGFYRVRHTGKPAHLTVDFKATRRGVELRFSDPLHTQSAADPSRFTAERWNYYWSGNYGSMEYSVTTPKQAKRDTLPVQSAKLSDDARTLTLDIADMRKCHQLQLNLKLLTPDGGSLDRVLYLTVPVLED
jgi:hypothetical protein